MQKRFMKKERVDCQGIGQETPKPKIVQPKCRER